MEVRLPPSCWARGLDSRHDGRARCRAQFRRSPCCVGSGSGTKVKCATERRAAVAAGRASLARLRPTVPRNNSLTTAAIFRLSASSPRTEPAHTSIGCGHPQSPPSSSVNQPDFSEEKFEAAAEIFHIFSALLEMVTTDICSVELVKDKAVVLKNELYLSSSRSSIFTTLTKRKNHPNMAHPQVQSRQLSLFQSKMMVSQATGENWWL
ncbi:uncharacterized protein LOC127575177 [Pristis pectinata]|uniref:uncharacterized protein LOC127575177 n=1 Tax=Pristis pectinata TaxID=685728 RepID=UPI00223D46D0|nr:uncharacterized protein LOC127575177 [Pristis pectinata]